MAAATLSPSRRKEKFHQFRQTYRDPTLSVMAALLAILIFVATPFQATIGFTFVPIGALLVLVMAAGIYILSGRRIVLIPIALAAILHFTLKILRDEHHALHADLYLVASLWLTLSVTFAAVVTRAVFAGGPVTTHRIVGAVLLYLLIALVFASLYVLVGASFPGAFSHMTIADTPRLGADVTYFSLTTITSVGYGDITPVHPIARSLCNLESICGQLYPAILLARLVSLHAERRK
jgi:Ion channel